MKYIVFASFGGQTQYLTKPMGMTDHRSSAVRFDSRADAVEASGVLAQIVKESMKAVGFYGSAQTGISEVPS